MVVLRRWWNLWVEIIGGGHEGSSATELKGGQAHLANHVFPFSSFLTEMKEWLQEFNPLSAWLLIYFGRIRVRIINDVGNMKRLSAGVAVLSSFGVAR